MPSQFNKRFPFSACNLYHPDLLWRRICLYSRLHRRFIWYETTGGHSRIYFDCLGSRRPYGSPACIKHKRADRKLFDYSLFIYWSLSRSTGHFAAYPLKHPQHKKESRASAGESALKKENFCNPDLQELERILYGIIAIERECPFEKLKQPVSLW